MRFHWVGESEAVADGKKSSTNLHILMNWQKQGADWKLLSRAVDEALIAGPEQRRATARSEGKAKRSRNACLMTSSARPPFNNARSTSTVGAAR